MATNYSLSSKIAEAIAKSTSVSFATAYLALFATVPDANGNGGVEISYPEYCRVKITTQGIEGKSIMGAVASEAGTGDDEGKMIAIVQNQEIIYFPENETGETVTAAGWGLFGTLSGGSPQLWGTFKKDGEPITKEIKAGAIPIFRISDFKIKVK